MSNPTPHDKLIGLINAANEKQWEAGQLVFSVPAEEDGEQNTSVIVTPAEGQPYTGNRILFYDRVDLSTSHRGQSTDFVLGTQSGTLDLVQSMRERFGVLITSADILSEPLPAPDFTGKITVTVKAHPDSYLWYGQIVVTLTPPLIPLDVAIATNMLAGLTLPDLFFP